MVCQIYGSQPCGKTPKPQTNTNISDHVIYLKMSSEKRKIFQATMGGYNVLIK